MPRHFVPLVLFACSGQPAGDSAPAEPGPGVLLVVADDMGVDALAAYADAYAIPDLTYAETPEIDRICGDGVRFTGAWANPLCSPTRATILTGLYGFRTGIGWAIAQDVEDEIGISPDAPSLPRLIGQLAPEVALAQVGKWHLGATEALGGDAAPNTMGWPHFAGGISDELVDYAAWQRTVDGVTAAETGYATSAQVDDAIAWLAELEPGQPWVLWLAFNAPHAPFHLPPDALHGAELSGEPEDIKARPVPYYRAAIQAMDGELGRLLGWMGGAGLDADLIFLGDNGSPRDVAAGDAERAKGALYEGGVRVPLCAVGPSVVGGRDVDAPVNSVDLFATALELSGASLADAAAIGLPDGEAFDAVSLLPHLTDPSAAPVRSWAFAETSPLGGVGSEGQAIRGTRYKLLRQEGSESLFDLQADPLEHVDLLAGAPDADAEAARAELASLLDSLLASE